MQMQCYVYCLADLHSPVSVTRGGKYQISVVVTFLSTSSSFVGYGIWGLEEIMFVNQTLEKLQ